MPQGAQNKAGFRTDVRKPAFLIQNSTLIICET